MALLKAVDVASPQASIDMEKVADYVDGIVYVKAGGDNVGRYVAPHYAAQVDAAKKAGIAHVGHYWVPGNQDPTGAADYLVSHLRKFDPKTDFVVLDNEALDRGRLYSDAEAARFAARVIEKAKIPAKSLFVYFGASDLRAMHWPRLEALGVQIIVASYGSNTGKRDHEPNLGGRFAGRWAGHQFTSRGKIPGYSGAIDLDVFQATAFDHLKPKAPAKPASKPEPAKAPTKAPTKAPAAKPAAKPAADPWTPPVEVGKALQRWARRGGYHGPIDGDLQEKSWIGVQTMLARSYGYAGLIDGDPQTLTGKALQRLAKRGGYDGPEDGEPGVNTWAGVLKALS